VKVFFAVVVTSVTLVAVFLPIFFLEGFTGKLFREFAIVVAGAIAISAFVSLSLSPMMSSRILHHQKHNSKLFFLIENFIISTTNSYNRIITKYIKKRWIAFGVILLSFGIIYFTAKNLQTELAPLEDKSQIRISATAPEGTSFKAMDVISDGIAKDCR